MLRSQAAFSAQWSNSDASEVSIAKAFQKQWVLQNAVNATKLEFSLTGGKSVLSLPTLAVKGTRVGGDSHDLTKWLKNAQCLKHAQKATSMEITKDGCIPKPTVKRGRVSANPPFMMRHSVEKSIVQTFKKKDVLKRAKKATKLEFTIGPLGKSGAIVEVQGASGPNDLTKWLKDPVCRNMAKRAMAMEITKDGCISKAVLDASRTGAVSANPPTGMQHGAVSANPPFAMIYSVKTLAQAFQKAEVLKRAKSAKALHFDVNPYNWGTSKATVQVSGSSGKDDLTKWLKDPTCLKMAKVGMSVEITKDGCFAHSVALRMVRY